MFDLTVFVLIMLHNLSEPMFEKHTFALRYTPTPLSIRLAGSTACSLQCVAYITGVGHYRVVGCIGETALTICGSTRIPAVDSWERQNNMQAGAMCIDYDMVLKVQLKSHEVQVKTSASETEG